MIVHVVVRLHSGQISDRQTREIDFAGKKSTDSVLGRSGIFSPSDNLKIIHELVFRGLDTLQLACATV